MLKMNDAFYERLTFGVKDDDDFSWSQDRSITLEVLSNEDREVVAYRYDENWVPADSIENVIEIFIAQESVTDYIKASGMSPEISSAMMKAVIELEVDHLNDEFGKTFTLIEGEEKVTEEYNNCYFIEESYLSVNASMDADNNVYFEGSDSSMSLVDIFDEYQDQLNENTTIVVVE